MRLPLAPGEDVVAAVRAARAKSLTVVIAPGFDSLALALARAAIGPLARERAPETRVNAVVLGPAHRPDDADAAIAFLEAAGATTGQLLDVN